MKGNTKENLLKIKKSGQLHEIMLSKLSIDEAYNYVKHNKDKANITKMRNFIQSGGLDKFIDLCIEIFPKLTQEDCDSIGCKEMTENAKEFLKLVQILEQHGFKHPPLGEFTINFWSGIDARKKAHEQKNELSDSDIPSICVLFDICALLQRIDNEKRSPTLLPQMISRAYAVKAQGQAIANVYLSSIKQSEPSGLKAGNCFWLIELPTLQNLKINGQLGKIHLHLFDPIAHSWEVIDFHSKESNAIQIIRRSAHLPDQKHSLSDKKPEIFEHYMKSEEFEKWRKSSEPRPAITVGKMRELCQFWLLTSKKKKLQAIVAKKEEPKLSWGA